MCSRPRSRYLRASLQQSHLGRVHPALETPTASHLGSHAYSHLHPSLLAGSLPGSLPGSLSRSPHPRLHPHPVVRSQHVLALSSHKPPEPFRNILSAYSCASRPSNTVGVSSATARLRPSYAAKLSRTPPGSHLNTTPSRRHRPALARVAHSRGHASTETPIIAS